MEEERVTSAEGSLRKVMVRVRAVQTWAFRFGQPVQTWLELGLKAWGGGERGRGRGGEGRRGMEREREGKRGEH